MSVCVAVPVELSATERHRLKKMAYGHKASHWRSQGSSGVRCG